MLIEEVKEPKTQETITIRVSDERKNVKDRNFLCKKDVLLREMKYFVQHMNSTDSANDLDISV